MKENTSFENRLEALGEALRARPRLNERVVVTEADETWIEFKLVLWRGDANLATLRVDPKTKLPVHLSFVSPKNGTKYGKLPFDYPSDGPTDVYALGVPRDVKIDDRIPSHVAVQVFQTMAVSRATIGSFRLRVAEEGDNRTFIVSRKGNRWRVDSCADLNNVIPSRPVGGQSVSDWFAERLRLSPQHPLYVCNGKAVFKNSAGEAGIDWSPVRNPAPPDLMSGNGLGHMSLVPNVKFASLLYPDLTPRRGWPFEFETHPAGMPECVLIKRSAQMATPKPLIGHEWYYVDPKKGYAVVRAELFTMPPDTPADPARSRSRQTLQMEDFRQSPHGSWYCTVLRKNRNANLVVPSGRTPQAPSAAEPAGNDQTPSEPESIGRLAPVVPKQRVNGTTQHLRTTIRYSFDFEADLPDSLFTVDPAKYPEE